MRCQKFDKINVRKENENGKHFTFGREVSKEGYTSNFFFACDRAYAHLDGLVGLFFSTNLFISFNF